MREMAMMDREDYISALREMNARPPIEETPPLQDFPIGTRVRVSKHLPACMSHFGNRGRWAIVEYSYYQKYTRKCRCAVSEIPWEEKIEGHYESCARSQNEYCLRFVGGTSSWWPAYLLRAKDDNTPDWEPDEKEKEWIKRSDKFWSGMAHDFQKKWKKERWKMIEALIDDMNSKVPPESPSKPR